jgi:hypothetical protein
MTSAKKAGRFPGRIFFADLILFLVSVFAMYVSATTERFCRSDIVAVEFFLALFFGGVLVFMAGRFIFAPPDEGRGGRNQ